MKISLKLLEVDFCLNTPTCKSCVVRVCISRCSTFKMAYVKIKVMNVTEALKSELNSFFFQNDSTEFTGCHFKLKIDITSNTQYLCLVFGGQGGGVGGLLGPRAVRVSCMAETECALGKPSV